MSSICKFNRVLARMVSRRWLSKDARARCGFDVVVGVVSGDVAIIKSLSHIISVENSSFAGLEQLLTFRGLGSKQRGVLPLRHPSS